MQTPDIIAMAVLMLVVGGAIIYIIRQKKKGVKCIGCPYSEVCKSKCSCRSCDIVEEREKN